MKMGLKSNYERLERKYESENDCYTEAGCKKPTRLTERTNQKYINKNSNWNRKSDCIIRM
jgi:hypothetical protein